MGGSADKTHRKILNFSFNKGLKTKNFQPFSIQKMITLLTHFILTVYLIREKQKISEKYLNFCKELAFFRT
jgi:hypothetical protein